jgi:hypothetical protein
MVLLAAYVAGGTTLACRRVESTQVDCTLSNARGLGQVRTEDVILKHVQGAHLESFDCSDTDSEGRRRSKTCNALVLTTATGEVRPDLSTPAAAEINNFIASKEPTLTVHNNRWIFSAALSSFALIWLGAGSLFWRLTKEEKRWKRSRAPINV